MKINYSIVDVFSEGKYTGNPLAVFKNAEHVSDREMQQIAKEINFSETTFILSDVKKIMVLMYEFLRRMKKFRLLVILHWERHISFETK